MDLHDFEHQRLRRILGTLFKFDKRNYWWAIATEWTNVVSFLLSENFCNPVPKWEHIAQIHPSHAEWASAVWGDSGGKFCWFFDGYSIKYLTLSAAVFCLIRIKTTSIMKSWLSLALLITGPSHWCPRLVLALSPVITDGHTVIHVLVSFTINT